MTRPTRPKIDPAVRPAMRKWLRRVHNTPPPLITRIHTRSLDAIAEYLGNNPHKLWDLAWEVDMWSCVRTRRGEDDGGACDLATALYDHAQHLAKTNDPGSAHLLGGHNLTTRGTRYRDMPNTIHPGPKGALV